MSVEIYLFKSYSHLRRKKRAVLPPVNRSETAFNRWKERFNMSEFKDCRAKYQQTTQVQIEFAHCSMLSSSCVLLAGNDRSFSIKNGLCLNFDPTQDTYNPIFPFNNLACNSRLVNCASMPEMSLVFFLFADGTLACGDALDPLKPATDLGHVKHRKNFFDNETRRVAVMGSLLILLTGKSDIEIIQVTTRDPVRIASVDYRIQEEIIRLEARGRELLGISPTSLFQLYLKN